MTPIISLFATAYRPQYWERLYESIKNNSIPFEIVFVGPNKPNYILPDNFYYIKSDVKPTQCLEIAARNTTGELIIHIADDLEFINSNPLEKLYISYNLQNSDKLMLSCKYMLKGEDVSGIAHHFFYGDTSSPLMPVGTILTKKLYTELGGMDKNFIAIHGELDIAMRLYAMGGKVILSDVYINEQRDRNYKGGLCDEYQKIDMKLLRDLWVVDGKAQFNRSKPFEPFTDYKILTESQGSKGRWK
jgi:hypothetical protein